MVTLPTRPCVSKNGGILLANVLQSSSRTFSCVSFPSVFAFKEGIWDTPISALGGSPTVSRGFSRHDKRSKNTKCQSALTFVRCWTDLGVCTADAQGTCHILP